MGTSKRSKISVVAFLLIVLSTSFMAGVVVAHALGFSSAELRFDSGRCQIELVVDAPDAEASTDEERRDQLRSRLEQAVWLEVDQQRVSLTQRLVSLGSGSSAVDVVEFRAPVSADVKQLRVGFAAGLGDVALEVRNPAGRSVFRKLLRDGEQTPEITLYPRKNMQREDTPIGDPDASAAPRPHDLRSPPPDPVEDPSSKRWIWLVLAGSIIALGAWLRRLACR